MRRAREWFGGLSEAGKVALVTAVITTVGGGVFGIIGATTSALGGASSADDAAPRKTALAPSGSDTPDGTADTPGTDLPTVTPECTVGSSILNCPSSKGEITFYSQRDDSSKVVHTRVNASSRFVCWGHGTYHLGNNIWYWAPRKDGYDYWGNVPAADVSTAEDPPPGLPPCG